MTTSRRTPSGSSTQSSSVRLARAAAGMRADLPIAALDAILVAGSYLGVLVLRFDGVVPDDWFAHFRIFLAFAVAAHLAANWGWGLYGQMWRHASVQEARRVLLAGGTALVVLSVLVFIPPRQVPASVLLLGGALAVMLIGMLRFQSRLFAFRRGTSTRTATRLLVIGAGESGAAMIRDMLRSEELALLPVAVLDDDPRKHGRVLHGIPVVGGIDSLAEAAARYRPQQALLAVPSADSGLVRRVARAADDAALALKVLPPVAEIVGGKVSVRDVRDLSIDDLLGRQQVHTDLDSVRRLLHGKRVMITGAGGSIGSEIARQAAQCDPAALLLLDHDETHLYDAAGSIHTGSTELLADVRDGALIDLLVARHAPDVIFHAAAHKHVPLLELHPCEAVSTNVMGTANVVAAAARHGVERLVFVSTDKAVRPASVMGASKRLGEQLVLAHAPPGARYCAVRFGNVLGSRGSVVPRFAQQIRNGGPVTVTDARMTRFFMSIPEAVQLVLQAAALSKGSEVFMLDMGEPVKILDLAERMIRLSGRRVGTDVEIRVVGARPGEKLEEELRTPDETPHPTAHGSIVALYPPVLDEAQFAEGFQRLHDLARQRDDVGAARLLHDLAGRRADVIRLPDSTPAQPERTLAWIRSST